MRHSGGWAIVYGEYEIHASVSLRTQTPGRTKWRTPNGASCGVLGEHMRGTAAGSHPAFEQLYAATRQSLRAYARRLIFHEPAVEELLADVYLYVWSHASAYDEARGTPMTWLRMLCRSRAIDALRTRDCVVLVTDFDAMASDHPVQCRDPADGACAIAAEIKVRSALDRLAPIHRQMLALAFFGGLSHTEISAHCKIRLGTVKSHVRRGLAALRIELGGAREDYV